MVPSPPLKNCRPPLAELLSESPDPKNTPNQKKPEKVFQSPFFCNKRVKKSAKKCKKRKKLKEITKPVPLRGHS